MRTDRRWSIACAILFLLSAGCQDVRLKDGIIYYKDRPAFIVGVWAGYSVTYKLPKFKEGLDPDLPMYARPCDKGVAEHVGFLSAHPAVPIRDTLERLAPQFITRPRETEEREYAAFLRGLGDLPLAMDFAAVHVLDKTRNAHRQFPPEMYQQNPGWHSFVPLCPENPEAWKIYEDYFRTGVRKTLAAGANPFVYEIFNEPAYNCQCRWNRKAFREQMPRLYRDISAANAVWGTAFRSFEEMEAVPTMRAYPGLWADWMKFIGDRYCDILLRAKDVMREADPREPVYFMEQPAVSMTYLRTTGIDPYKVAKVMDAVGMEGGVSFGAFKPLSSDDPMAGVIVNPSLLSHQIHLDMARSFGKPVINTEFYCARFHDGVRFPSRRSDLTTGLWVELLHGVSSDYFYNWGRRWWEWKDMAGAKRGAREEYYKAFCLLNPYDYPPDSLYGIRDFDQEMKALGEIALPMPRIRGQVAMLVSNPTIRMMMQKFPYTSSGETNPYEMRMLDWYTEIIFSHVQLDMLYEEDLSPETLRHYQALLVPKTEYTYPRTLDILRRHVAEGGRVIAEQGSFAMDEYGHNANADLRAEWIEADLKGPRLRDAVLQALDRAGVRPPIALSPADEAKDPLTVEAYLMDRPGLRMVFLLSWGVRSRLAHLQLPGIGNPPDAAKRSYEMIDPIAGVSYPNNGQATWSAEDLRKGVLVALPSQTRKVLLLTEKPRPGRRTPLSPDGVREEYRRALAADEKELAMVAEEFEAERKAKESMVVDFGGPKRDNGSYAADPATVLLCHLDGGLDADSGLKPEVKGSPQFVPGRFGTQGIRTIGEDRVVFALPPSFNKDRGTFEAWVKPDWLPNDGKRHAVFALKGDGDWNQNGMGLYKNLNFEFTFYVYDKEKRSHVVQVPINIFQKGTWVHLAAAWDASSGMKLYVNGELAKETKATWAMDAMPKIWIGNNSGGQQPWEGVLDEVRLSNSVRMPTAAK